MEAFNSAQTFIFISCFKIRPQDQQHNTIPHCHDWDPSLSYQLQAPNALRSTFLLRSPDQLPGLQYGMLVAVTSDKVPLFRQPYSNN